MVRVEITLVLNLDPGRGWAEDDPLNRGSGRVFGMAVVDLKTRVFFRMSWM